MSKVYTFLILLALSFTGLVAQTTSPEWVNINPLPESLEGHRSLLLPDGNVLICGGINASGETVSSAYIYEYENGNVRKVASMNNDRAFHSLVAIPTQNGANIYVIGGYSGTNNNYASVRSIEKITYTNNQQNVNWNNIESMTDSRADLNATWNNSDRIIINGGYQQNGGDIRTGNKLASSEYININNDRVNDLPDMEKSRAGHFLGTVVDGNDDYLTMTAGGEVTATSTELLENDAWSSQTFAPRTYREFAASLVDRGYIARIFGGYDDAGNAQNTCEWYDVKAGWKYFASMLVPRAEHGITVIAGIEDSTTSYLVAGGTNSNTLASTEYYTLPTTSTPTGVWSQLGQMNSWAKNRTTNIEGNNLAMVTGGRDDINAIDGIEIYQPFLANDANFSPEEVGRISDSIRITITNRWLLPVRATNFRINSPDYFYTGDTTDFVLAPGQSRRLNVWFRPSQEGERNATLDFTVGPLENKINLSGEGIKSNIEVLTAEEDFGEVFLGDEKIQCFEAVRNNGTDTTYIDSISVQPPGSYEVVSPTSRVNIPPDSSLEVCIRFLPGSRGTLPSNAIVHIADRQYSSGLTGRGIVKYLSGYGPQGCDTVTYEENNTYQASIILNNPGDRDINVTGFQIIGGSANLFDVNQNFPIQLGVGEDTELFVDFNPPSEGTFDVDVEFEHDGNQDSTVIIPVCFVMRSNSLRLSTYDVDYGNACVGDSLTQNILIENPSNFETITIDNASIINPASPFIITNFNAVTLQPRGSTNLTVSMVAANTGNFNDFLEITGSFGSVDIPLNTEINPGLDVSPSVVKHYYNPGNTFVIPYEVNGADANGVNNLDITLNFNTSLLLPLRIVDINGTQQVDENLSQINVTGIDEAEAEIVWQNPVTTDGEAFGIEYEVLRGDNSYTSVRVENEVSEDACLTGSKADFFVDQLCGGRDGQIVNDANAPIINVYPLPAHDDITVYFYGNSESAFSIELVNTLGNVVYQDNVLTHENTETEKMLNTDNLPSGTYILRVSQGANKFYNRVILISK